MRLNLGAGRATLPTRKGRQVTAHVERYLPDSAYSEDWLNVDHHELPGIGEVTDLFSYPWLRSSNGLPWETDSITEIWASHIVEHIPHDAALNEYATDPLKQSAITDGWFAWFYEAWRILRPGGKLHLVIPFGASRAGMIDPSHRRYVMPSTFSYFNPNPDAPFDYFLPYRFNLTDGPEIRVADINNINQQDSPGQIARDIVERWNVVDEFYLALEPTDAD